MNPTADYEKTRELLIKQYRTYPRLAAEDIFKFLFQSTFGCEHMLSREDEALNRIKEEYETLLPTQASESEPLDGAFSRVPLSCLAKGLAPETLARLFCLSAQKERGSKALLEQKLRVAKELVAQGLLPVERDGFFAKADQWQRAGYGALHHSDEFRAAYRPAYRVIANEYVFFLPIFTEIDKRLKKGALTVAIEGGSASGKTTLAEILHRVYDCNVFHMDDFFLRPEQRTPKRFAEIGGNVDRERFYERVVTSLMKKEAVCYRPFDCSTQALKEAITVPPKKLSVVEGVYSMHPFFGEYFGLAVFLDISADDQRRRIEKRNSPALAKRFFDEWIPLENAYFAKMPIRSRCDLVIPVGE